MDVGSLNDLLQVLKAAELKELPLIDEVILAKIA
jgi:hypothetical protein